jgi:hypothetical protein
MIDGRYYSCQAKKIHHEDHEDHEDGKAILIHEQPNEVMRHGKQKKQRGQQWQKLRSLLSSLPSLLFLLLLHSQRKSERRRRLTVCVGVFHLWSEVSV